MATGRCASCGAGLPVGAAFCPSCGAAVDAVPVLPLAGERSAADLDATRDERPRSGRTLVAVVAAVIGVLVVLSSFSGGEDPGEEAGSTSTTSTTRPPRTTTTGPTSTSVPGPVLPGGALPAASGLALVGRHGDGIVVVELGSGAQATVAGPPSGPADLLGVSAGGLLALSDGEVALLGGPGADSPWRPIDVSGWRVDWIDPRGLLVLGVRDAAGVTTFGGVDADGSVVVLPLDDRFQAASSGVAAVEGGRVLLSTLDGVYQVAEDGTADRVATGRLLDVANGRLLRYGCDDSFDCRASVVDLSGAAPELVLPPLPIPGDYWVGGLSPDGRRVWVSGYDQRTGREVLHVHDGERWTSTDVDAGSMGSYRWTEDGSTLVWIDSVAGEVSSLAVGGPAAGVVTTVAIERDGLRRDDNGQIAVLVPVSMLPPGLVPPG